MDTLTSPQNSLIKEIRKALSHRGLTSAGFCVAESFHLLEEALNSGCEIEAVLTTEAVRSAVESRIRGIPRVRTAVIPDDLFLSLSTTETSQGVIALVRPPRWSLAQLLRGQCFIVVLDGLQDPGNLGTILRATEAFGGSGVALLKGCVDPYNPKALRASAGSIFRVPLVAGLEEQTLLAAIEQRHVDLFAAVAASAAAHALEDCRLSRRCAVIIGSEGRGVRERLRLKAADLRIPTVGVESLNAAMAATVILYEARRQRMTELHEPL